MILFLIVDGTISIHPGMSSTNPLAFVPHPFLCTFVHVVVDPPGPKIDLAEEGRLDGFKSVVGKTNKSPLINEHQMILIDRLKATGTRGGGVRKEIKYVTRWCLGWPG